MSRPASSPLSFASLAAAEGIYIRGSGGGGFGGGGSAAASATVYEDPTHVSESASATAYEEDHSDPVSLAPDPSGPSPSSPGRSPSPNSAAHLGSSPARER